MKSLFVATAVVISLTVNAHSQHSPPFTFNCLNKILLTQKKTTLDLSLTYARDGGTKCQREYSQMYLVLYLDRNESKVREIVNNRKTRQKKSNPDSQFLAILERDSLGVVLATKSSKSTLVIPEDLANQTILAVDEYNYQVSFDDVLKSARKLSNSAGEPNKDKLRDHLRIFVLVPVNDSNYADKIPPDAKSESFGSDDSPFDGETLVQYLGFLPFRILLMRGHNGTPIIMVD